jgi:hypothetical protein
MMTGRNEVARLRHRLQATFDRIGSLPADIEIQSDFARYLCVLVSSFIENCVIELLLDHVRRCAAPSVVRYSEAQLSRFTNANVRRILDLVGAFEPDWRIQLEGFIVDEREAAINSVIAIRHQIAHGDSAGISYVRIKTYYQAVDQVIDFLADLCDPPS